MDNEYMEELREMLDSAIEGLPLNYSEQRSIALLTQEPFEFDEDDIENLASVIQKARETGLPRMMEEYEVTQALHVGDREVLFGKTEKPTAEHGNCPYLVAVCSYDNPIDAAWPEKMTAYTDYTVAVSAFVAAVQTQLEAVRAERQQRGDNPPLNYTHCIPGSEHTDYTGKVVVYDANAMRPEYQHSDCQIYLASGGNGCNPEGHGRAVFATNLYTGEDTRLNRPHVLGIIQPECVPEWAAARLAEIQARRDAPAKSDAPEKPKKKQAPGRDAR